MLVQFVYQLYVQTFWYISHLSTKKWSSSVSPKGQVSFVSFAGHILWQMIKHITIDTTCTIYAVGKHSWYEHIKLLDLWGHYGTLSNLYHMDLVLNSAKHSNIIFFHISFYYYKIKLPDKMFYFVHFCEFHFINKCLFTSSSCQLESWRQY